MKKDIEELKKQIKDLQNEIGILKLNNGIHYHYHNLNAPTNPQMYPSNPIYPTYPTYPTVTF